jgi:hypothetical protein
MRKHNVIVIVVGCRIFGAQLASGSNERLSC